MSVSDGADLYFKTYKQIWLELAENAILPPLALTHESFIAHQQELSSKVASEITLELQRFNDPRLEIESIITGIDNTGPHIFVADQLGIHNLDAIGFASIGAGKNHADSQFMFAGHTANAPMSQTLLLIYMAKKHAEVAPGVGKATDIMMIGPSRPELSKVLDEEVFNT